MENFKKAMKRSKIILPYMYEVNKNYLERKKNKALFKGKYNKVIKFLEGAKNQGQGIKYYNWNDRNKVKNALYYLKKVGVRPSVINSLKSNLKFSENTMKKAFNDRRKNVSARKIQSAYRDMFRFTPPKQLYNYALINPMARRIIQRRLNASV